MSALHGKVNMRTASRSANVRSRATVRPMAAVATAPPKTTNTYTTTVRMTCPLKIGFGEVVKLVGSDPALGDWDSSKAPEMSIVNGNTWTIDLNLKPGEYEFKAVVYTRGYKRSFFEDVPDRRIRIPDAPGALDISCAWGNASMVTTFRPKAPGAPTVTATAAPSAAAAQAAAAPVAAPAPAPVVAAPKPPPAALVRPDEDPTNLYYRHDTVLKSFPKALSVDDYMSRVELALAGYGFTGDNTIAMSNLCRDESCLILEDKIEGVFGSCFSTHGLGGVLTCGVIGIKAGLSHSPVQGGKERYAFFSFPHIAIDSNGTIGGISRPNRPKASSACGALIACTNDLKTQGLEACTSEPGEHDPLEPEYSILKQRLARRLQYEGADSSKLDLVAVTQAAERTISADLEYLIEKGVDTSKADYAVFTGVQIHNWAADLDDPSIPSLEFISVGKCYVVINGQKTYIDLHKVPALSPRMIRALSGDKDVSAATCSSNGMIQEIPREYLLKRLGGLGGPNTANRISAPGWSEYVKTTYAEAHPGAPRMDSPMDAFLDSDAEEEEEFNTTFQDKKHK